MRAAGRAVWAVWAVTSANPPNRGSLSTQRLYFGTRTWVMRSGGSTSNTLAMMAARAAWSFSSPWVELCHSPHAPTKPACITKITSTF